jgi:hypothetical protein
MLVLETFQVTNGLYHPHCCQKTIKKENKVKTLDEIRLNSMSAKAQKSRQLLTACSSKLDVFFFHHLYLLQFISSSASQHHI